MVFREIERVSKNAKQFQRVSESVRVSERIGKF